MVWPWSIRPSEDESHRQAVRDRREAAALRQEAAALREAVEVRRRENHLSEQIIALVMAGRPS